MNILPTYAVILVNTKVAIDRIAQFLDEEEVPAFVSDLKVEDMDGSLGNGTMEQDQRLGINNGWFRWNQAVEPPEKKPAAKKTWKIWRKSESLPTVTEAPGVGDPLENGDGTSTPVQLHRFELRDIDIMFPTGQMTIVTGPTGKSRSPTVT